MAKKAVRSIRNPIHTAVTLAAADDLDGDNDTLDVSGSRVIYVQIDNGAAGTTGIDVIEKSTDGGSTWVADDTLQAVSESDFGGDIVTGAALNAAGIEPTGAAVFKGGPYDNAPTLVRCSRDTSSGGGTDWTTGAPTVIAIRIG